MTTQTIATPVGAMDPELRNSPIIEDTDEEFEYLAQMTEDTGICYFNDTAYKSGNYVCSGSSELLQCRQGSWVRMGGCDPDNP